MRRKAEYFVLHYASGLGKQRVISSFYVLAIFLRPWSQFVRKMATRTLLPSSVTYKRMKCPDLLEYAKASRDNGIFNDVTIQTGHVSIGANRMVLSCNSTFFEERFKSKMKDQSEFTITIEQMDATALKHLIDYMYDGSITIDSANVMDILAVADFLQMAEVKLISFEFLKERVSLDNWYAVLSAAKLYSCDQLQKYTYQFITEHLDEIAQSTDFKAVTKDDLTLMTSNWKKSTKTVDESVICKLVLYWTKQNEEERKAVFTDLFQIINLRNLPLYCLQRLFEETLVQNNPICAKAITAALFSIIRKDEPESMGNKTLSIVSIGGKATGRKVIEVLNFSKREEKKYPNLPYAVRSHCSVKMNDIVYCIGGCDSYLNIYDKVCQMNLNETNLKWEQGASLNEKRCEASAALFDGCLVVAGGWNLIAQLSSVEYTNNPSSKWELASPLLHKRCGNALVVCNGSLYALGGFDGTTCLSSVERLHFLDGEWQNIESMLTPRYGFAAVTLKGHMYAIGGRSDPFKSTALSTVERYVPFVNKWTNISGMRYRRSFHCACVVEEKIFVIGGHDENGNVIKEIECYEPSKDEWRVLKDLEHSLHAFALITG